MAGPFGAAMRKCFLSLGGAGQAAPLELEAQQVLNEVTFLALT